MNSRPVTPPAQHRHLTSTARRTLSSLALTLLLAVMALPAAAQVLPAVNRTDFICAGNLETAFGCTSQDIDVAQAIVETVDGDPITSCTAGDELMLVVKLLLTQNGQTRYDALVWIGEDGNDPRVAVPTDPNNNNNAFPDGPSCYVSSLPGFEINGEGFLDQENGADACNDSVDADQEILQIVGPLAMTCADSDNDGNLDLQSLITWQNNPGQSSCGDPGADPTTPHPVTGFQFNPNSNNPKCKFGTINVPVEVQNATLTVRKVYVPGDVDFDFISNPDLPGTTAGAFTLGAGNGYEQVFDVNVPVNGELYTIDETGPMVPGVTLQSAVCDDAGNSDPRGGITLNPGDNVTCTFTNNAQGSININKTANPTSVNAVGQVVTYNFAVSNTGPITLTNVQVTDNTLPGLGPISCNGLTQNGAPFNLGGSLAAGDAVNCSAQYAITQDDINAGGVDNTATATGDDDEGTVMDTDPASVQAVQDPSLMLRKAALNGGVSTDSYSFVGEVIDYTYDVTNDGNVSLPGPVTISDDRTPDANQTTPVCPAVSTVGNADNFLDPGETIQCTAQRIISQDDLNVGQVRNEATASAGGTQSNLDFATIDAIQNPALSLDKSASQSTYSTVGQTITYTYLVTNSGNISLAGPVTVADDQETVTCPAVSTVGNNDSFLDPGESISCTASRDISQADINDGSVTNVATASADGVDSNQDQVTINANQNPGLTLVKAASPGTYDAVDEVISYTYNVTNSGNVSLAGPVTVADDQETVTCPDVSTVGNNDGFLDPGETIQCSASRTIDQQDIDNGSVTNVATASADGTDSNTDQETVTSIQNLDLLLDKQADISVYATVGQVINYTYTITNTGNVTLVGAASVVDDQESVTCPPITELAPGDSVVCTASHVVTQEDIDNGSLTNVATASVGDTDSNEDTETVNADQNPALSLEKSASPTSYNAVDQVISYSYLVTNIGNTTLAGPVTVADDQETVTCPALSTVGNGDGNLDPGESVTCSASRTISQQDIDDGSVTNVATASADGVDSNPSQETINATQNRTLSLDKTVNPTTYALVGDVLNYTFVVTNVGNTTLAGPVTINDPLVTGTCPDGDLAPGDSIDCTGSLVIDQDDIDAGNVLNEARAEADGVQSNQADANATVLLGNLIIAKDATGDDREFMFTSSSLGDFSITTVNGVGSQSFNNIQAGTYDIAEIVPEEWDLQSFECSNGDSADAVTIEGDGTVTCTAVNTQRMLGVATLTEICVRDTPFVDYVVDAQNFDPGVNPVTIRWIKQDGSNEVAQELTNQPLSGRLLWPGTVLGPDGAAIDWPGWILVDGVWIQVDDGLRPTMLLEFEVNPTTTAIVDYPPPTPFCAGNPTQVLAEVSGPRLVPTLSTWALILLSLLMAAGGYGWHMRQQRGL